MEEPHTKYENVNLRTISPAPCENAKTKSSPAHYEDLRNIPKPAADCVYTKPSSSSAIPGHKASKCVRLIMVIVVCLIGLIALSGLVLGIAAYFNIGVVAPANGSLSAQMQLEVNSGIIASMQRQIEQLAQELMTVKAQIANASQGIPSI